MIIQTKIEYLHSDFISPLKILIFQNEYYKYLNCFRFLENYFHYFIAMLYYHQDPNFLLKLWFSLNFALIIDLFIQDSTAKVDEFKVLSFYKYLRHFH